MTMTAAPSGTLREPLWKPCKRGLGVNRDPESREGAAGGETRPMVFPMALSLSKQPTGQIEDTGLDDCNNTPAHNVIQSCGVAVKGTTILT